MAASTELLALPFVDRPTIQSYEGALPSGLLERLLRAVMAVLAEALEIVSVPEQALVSLVLFDVVGNELACVGLDAFAPPAREVIPDKDAPSELLPSGSFIPGAIGLCLW